MKRNIQTTDDDAEQLTLLSQLPKLLLIDEQSISLQYKLIDQPEQEGKLLLLILSDVTDKLKSAAKIEYLSYHDSLTGLYNRAYIEKISPHVFTPANLPLSILVADMNALKLVNDIFGHQQGDQLIISTAGVLQKCCRQTDIVTRWGGDEFLLLLPNTSAHHCQEVVNRIKKWCAEAVQNPIEISVAIGTATMDKPDVNFRELFTMAENEMYRRKLLETKAVRKRIIGHLEANLQKRCLISAGHISRIKATAIKFAQLLGLSPAEIKNLLLLAALHDIGYVALPEAVLKKPGSLTPEEWEIIRNHSEIGYRMAQSIGEVPVAEAILAMHERWDGKGYPHGLKGKAIPLIARLLSIVDVFDVLTHDRIYRKALTWEQAQQEILNQRGLQFDPYLVNQFIDHINELEPQN